MLKNQSVGISALDLAHVKNSWNWKSLTLNPWVLWIASTFFMGSVCVRRWTSSEAVRLIPSCRILSVVGLWVSNSSASAKVTIKVFGCWGCSLTAVLGNFWVYQGSCSVFWTWFLRPLSEGGRRGQWGRSAAGMPCLWPFAGHAAAAAWCGHSLGREAPVCPPWTWEACSQGGWGASF